MTKKNSTISTLAVAALLAVGASIALTQFGTKPGTSGSKASAAVAAVQWTATAPGRVEPRNGEIKLSSQTPGRVVEIPVKVNDPVRAGDLLLRVDDDETRAKILSAEAEAGVRKRERDQENAVGKPAVDRRAAEDAFANAERAHNSARFEFDRALRAFRDAVKDATEETVQTARTALATAHDKLQTERTAMKRAQSVANLPLQTRLESGLANARADVSLALAAHERTRIRAPVDGTVLQVNPRVGELAGASPENVLVTVGDLTALRVKAEVEERDISKVQVGQPVVIRSDAYAGRDFTGKVARLAKTMAPSKMSQRGPRRPNDLDALEVIVELDPTDLLLPGMRVDVMFKADAAMKAEAPAATSAKTPAATK